MFYQPKNPVGYRNLLTWKQAGKILVLTKEYTKKYLCGIKDRRLQDHMESSARSVQRNIEEGFKRATTKEYIQFLGYSRGSLEELKGDFEELLKESREGLRKGQEGIVKGIVDLIYGEDCMLGRQIRGLENKMVSEKTMPANEVIRNAWKRQEANEKRFKEMLEKDFGLVRQDNGSYRHKGQKGKEG
jgi:four helix bundle protein